MAMTIRLQAEDGEKVDAVDDPQGFIVDRLHSLSGRMSDTTMKEVNRATFVG
jgi:hypothetical protein